jgi:hypothetical protein
MNTILASFGEIEFGMPTRSLSPRPQNSSDRLLSSRIAQRKGPRPALSASFRQDKNICLVQNLFGFLSIYHSVFYFEKRAATDIKLYMLHF